jgi:hypothetical protein
MTDKAKLKQQIEEMEAKLEEMRSELDKAEKWEPEGGRWAILSSGSTAEAPTILEYKFFGTERKTKEAAEKACDEMRVFNRLLAYRDEFAPGYEPDWDNINEEKAYVYILPNKEYAFTSECNSPDIGKVYMPKDVAEELARKLNIGEVKL